MNQKWNLQDIRPVSSDTNTDEAQSVPIKKSRAARPKKDRVARPQTVESDVEHVAISNGNKKKNRSLILVVVLFFAIIAAGFGASALMKGAEVTVYPKFKEPNVNAVFTAMRVKQPDELAYEIMTLEAEGERQVTAAGQEDVTAQAEGTILIYNEHSTDSVRLVTNTRFESPDGLIYKIKDSAVVPGYTTGDDGQKAPGVTTADVFAAEAGENYNIAPATFTIPGFKGSPEFDGVYGESIEAMVGGFSGLKFIIDETELQTAQQALRLELRNSLLEQIGEQRPAGFALFDEAVSFTYVTLPSVQYGDNLATIKEKALMRIPLFKEEEFASYIAKATIPGYEGEPVRIEDYESLSFGYTNSTTSASDISAVDSLDFKLVGKPMIVWTYDAGKLTTDLLGLNKTGLRNLLSAYPAIVKAEAIIRPFWKSKFPMDLSDITITENIKNE